MLQGRQRPLSKANPLLPDSAGNAGWHWGAGVEIKLPAAGWRFVGTFICSRCLSSVDEYESGSAGQNPSVVQSVPAPALSKFAVLLEEHRRDRPLSKAAGQHEAAHAAR